MIFYGVYLENTGLSTALDLIRFLGEPDSIRFSHITLRGPYHQRLSRAVISQINDRSQDEWKVKLLRSGHFFSAYQNTVFIQLDLSSLRTILHKPDFPHATPHLTLYDGRDRYFAQNLYGLLNKIDWCREVNVTRLREIEDKHIIDEVFVEFFVAFDKLFREIIGDSKQILGMKDASVDRRLTLVETVLGKLKTRAEHPYGPFPLDFHDHAPNR